jgi:PHD/YefM family antitoxin component YafN of YafNO toxin-antitoxin module
MAYQIRQTGLRMTQLHRQLYQVIRQVACSNEHFVVEKDGLPVAVLLSMQEYERLIGELRVKQHERLARALGEEAQRQGLTEEQLMAEMEESKRKTYDET